MLRSARIIFVLLACVSVVLSCKTSNRDSSTLDTQAQDKDAVDYKLVFYPKASTTCTTKQLISASKFTSEYPIKIKVDQEFDSKCNYTLFLVISKDNGTTPEGKRNLTPLYTNQNSKPTQEDPSGVLIEAKPLTGLDGSHSTKLYKLLVNYQMHIPKADAFIKIVGSKVGTTEATITAHACDDLKCWAFNPATGMTASMSNN